MRQTNAVAVDNFPLRSNWLSRFSRTKLDRFSFQTKFLDFLSKQYLIPFIEPFIVMDKKEYKANAVGFIVVPK